MMLLSLFLPAPIVALLEHSDVSVMMLLSLFFPASIVALLEQLGRRRA